MTRLPGAPSAKLRLANWIQRAVTASLRAGLAPLGPARRDWMLFGIAQQLTPTRSVQTARDHRVRFYCPSDDTAARATTLLTKEPETIRWIESFGDGDVLWDIGANVGSYAIYAAVEMGVEVVAFEPSAVNYWILNKNIELNHVDRLISAYCLALSRGQQRGIFNMADTEPGGACYLFGEDLDRFDYPGVGQRQVIFHQAMLGFSVDGFLDAFDPPFPAHIKIDVDGLEQEILDGATRTLADPRLQSVLVEVDETAPDHGRGLIGLLERGGLSPVNRTLADIRGRVPGIYNYIFRRTNVECVSKPHDPHASGRMTGVSRS